MGKIDWKIVWAEVLRYQGKFPNISEGTIGKLTGIVPHLHGIRSDDPIVTTKNLRRVVGPHLQNAEIRLSLCEWIVKAWGGISSHDGDRFRKMISQFGRFSMDECWSAIDRIETFDRISSWSKLVSFAQPSSFAVFDARLAAALNTLHAINGLEARFYIPATQNGSVAKNRVRMMGSGPYLKYRDYIGILKDAAQALEIDLQDVEMTLFAKSLAICRSDPHYINWVL